MKPVVVTLILAAAASPAASAQTQTQLKDAYQKKLQSSFLSKAAWTTDYDKAREDGGNTRKPIFAYFTRSDAPSPLNDEFERGLLSEAAFVEWAPAVVLYCHITTRIQATPNDDLLTRVGGQGYPFIAFLAPDGSVLVRHGGVRTLDAIGASAKRAAALLAIHFKALDGDPAAKADLEFARLEMDTDTLKLDDAKKRVAALGELDAGRKKRAVGVLADIETFEVLRAVTRNPRSHADAAERLAAMKKDGRLPESRAAVQAFWIHWMDAAERRKDAAAFSEGLEALRARFGAEPDTKPFFDERDERLKKLK